MGPTRLGFCCCERGLNVFTISIAIHPLFACKAAGSAASPIQHPEPGRSLAMFRDTHMGRFSAKLDHHQFSDPVVSVSCSIATVTRRQIAAPA
jgi:hypothetical protein